MFVVKFVFFDKWIFGQGILKFQQTSYDSLVTHRIKYQT